MSTYTPRTMPPHIRGFAAAVLAALERGVSRALVDTNRAAQANLSGGQVAPWSYPVPNRSSRLLTGQKQQQDTPSMGYVFNTAAYAGAIHSGYVNEWAGRGKSRMRMKAFPRPFLDDAVATAQPLMVIQRTLEKALPQWS